MRKTVRLLTVALLTLTLLLTGGPIPGAPPEWPAARNISADPVAGVGSWTEDDFRRALTEGLRPDGSAISEVMPWRAYAHL